MKFSREFKIGAFVVIVLALTFFVINFLRGKDLFNQEMDVVARFENVNGLLPAAPLTVRGFKAGAVTDVEYDRDRDDFVVTCSVKREFRIPKDSRLVICSTDIMGGKGTRIDLGSSSELLEDGGELVSGLDGDLIASLSEHIGPLMEGLSSAFIQVNELLGNVNDVLCEETKEDIGRTLKHARAMMAHLEKVSGRMERKMPEVESFISGLSTLSEQLGTVVSSADSAMVNVRDITAEVKEMDLGATLDSLNQLLKEIQNPEGTIGRVLKDGQLYDSVDSLVVNLTDLVRKMQENPKKYMRISVF